MNKILLISLAVVLAISVGLVGCVPAEEPPTAIKIFAVRPLTGGLQTIGNYAFTPVMYYWEDKVNASGGIYVEEYGKNLTVEITIQDDESNIDYMVGNLTAAIQSGDYHFVLPSVGSEFLMAAANICSAYEYVLMGAEGGCTAMEDSLSSYPYLFAMLNFSTWNQMEKLFEILVAWQDEEITPTPMNVYIIYVADPVGYDYMNAFVDWADNYPGRFNIVGNVPVPVFTTDLEDQLAQAAGNDTHLLCSFTYPPTSLETIRDAADNGFNFNATIVGPGGNWEFTLLPRGVGPGGVGGDLIEGVMSLGAWNEYSSPKLKKFAADLIAFNWSVTGMGRYAMDWWGAAPYYAGLQIFQQAIERAGTLNNNDVRAELAAAWPGSPTNPPFSTVLGDAYFTDADGSPVPVTGTLTGGLLAKDCYAGQIGQWQHVTEANDWRPDGDTTSPARAKPYGIAADATEWWILEVIDLDANNTADGIYPKPPWP